MSHLEHLTTEILVVGGGTGGTAAAIQAARRGIKTILVSEFSWLGGMLTSAGVSAPDGNELAAFQTGLWGAFLRELQQREPDGLDHAWVSFFTYDPRTGAEIFADWVRSLPHLHWITGQTPLEVLQQGNRITGIRFQDVVISATITLDATELGDVLALAEVPHRWGWELQAQWHEPSAPATTTPLTQLCPVQSPTWVVVLQDFGEAAIAPTIPAATDYSDEPFIGAWEGYEPEQFLNYGRLLGDRFMINWPQCGNDYGVGLNRLIESPQAQQEFLQEAHAHSQNFAHFIQTHLGNRYGLATPLFPEVPGKLGGGAYALHPYYRESRRLQGMATVREQDILPIPGGQVAALPIDAQGQISAIAIGNYANDHHYPTTIHEQLLPPFSVKPKSIRWGGRWTGTPFTIPYGCLVPAHTDGLLVCEKNISVSHIANGATRLQPTVMNIGQAAGMAAALCIEHHCQPRDLNVRSLQEALLSDPIAPAAIIPCFDLPPDYPDWLYWQRYYLDHPDAYPANGHCLNQPQHSHPKISAIASVSTAKSSQRFSGIFHRQGTQDYSMSWTAGLNQPQQTASLVTLQAHIDQQLQTYPNQQPITIQGRLNPAGSWILIDEILVR